MTKADPKSRRTIEIVGRDRLTTFLRAIRSVSDVHAAELVNEDLDRGASLDEIFLSEEELGFYVRARRLGARRFKMAFGFVAGATAGDGGEWTVTFGEEGEVADLQSGIAVIF